MVALMDLFIRHLFTMVVWKVFTLSYINASAELDGFRITYLWILLLLKRMKLYFKLMDSM